MMRYPHAEIVTAYTQYLTQLGFSVDSGSIAPADALASYQQTSKNFNEAIAGADAQRAEQGRRQFMDRLAVLGATYAEQDRQRAAAAAASRPVVCSVTGVYVQNTVVCN